MVRRVLVNLLAAAGLGSLFVGLWWERPAVALIVVGGLVFVCAARVYVADYRQQKANNVGEAADA